MIIKIFTVIILSALICVQSADNIFNVDSQNHNRKYSLQQVAFLGSDTNMFCFFAYARWAKTSIMRETFPNAVRAGVARLPYHRLDFDFSTKLEKGVFPRIFPDCGYEVWGAIFTVPIQDLDFALSKNDYLIGNRSRDVHLEQKIVQVYAGNEEINLRCSAFQATVFPEKVIYGLSLPKNRRPSRQMLNEMVDAFEDANLPQQYIQQVSQLPTKD